MPELAQGWWASSRESAPASPGPPRRAADRRKGSSMPCPSTLSNTIGTFRLDHGEMAAAGPWERATPGALCVWDWMLRRACARRGGSFDGHTPYSPWLPLAARLPGCSSATARTSEHLSAKHRPEAHDALGAR